VLCAILFAYFVTIHMQGSKLKCISFLFGGYFTSLLVFYCLSSGLDNVSMDHFFLFIFFLPDVLFQKKKCVLMKNVLQIRTKCNTPYNRIFSFALLRLFDFFSCYL
jgi:hypothetical protein